MILPQGTRRAVLTESAARQWEARYLRCVAVRVRLD